MAGKDATVLPSFTGSGNALSGGYLGSIAVTLTNLGSIAITPPWTLTLTGDEYVGISQAFGLVRTSATSSGVSGVAQDTWNILWPDSTNQVTLGLVAVASTNTSFAPSAVSHPPGTRGLQLYSSTQNTLQICSRSTISFPGNDSFVE